MKDDNTETGYGIDASAKEFKVFGNTEEVQKIVGRRHIKNMTADGQRGFLERNMKGLTPSGKAEVGKHFRRYCKEKWLKLDELFDSSEHRSFMNRELRDFLNLSDRGMDDYTWLEITAENSGWRELPSFGAQYHQTKADRDRIHIIVQSYGGGKQRVAVYNRLNAKFVHEDGREAVFKYINRIIQPQLVTKYPDKGTFNYYTNANNIVYAINSIPYIGEHDKWDIQPYFDIVPEKRIIKRCNIFLSQNNSYYWELEEGQVVGPFEKKDS